MPSDTKSPTASRARVPNAGDDRDSKYRQRYGEMLDAAAAVFASRGYHGASTKDIAEQLGIRQGSLYYYFPSKQEALAEVCRRGADGFVARLNEVIAQPKSVTEHIRNGISVHLSPMLTHRPYVKVFLKERKNLEAANRRKVGESSRSYEQVWEDLLSAGMAEGALRPDLQPRVVVLGLLGMMNGTFDWFEGSQDELEKVAAAYAELFLDGIAPAG